MQTAEVTRTVRWIKSLFAGELAAIVSGDALHRDIPAEVALALGYSLGEISAAISRNERAIEILKAFGLECLLPGKMPSELIDALVGKDRGEPGKRPEIYEKLVSPWFVMTHCVGPIETLTMPEELRSEESPDGLLSVEIRREGEDPVPMSCLAMTSTLLEDAYRAVARAYGTDDAGVLTIIKVESGSGIRIDCKGLGEPVKHVKDLIIEAWNKLRHKRAEALVENNRAVLSSLMVIEHISQRQKDGDLSPEEAEKLKRRVTQAACGLFECGALIAEIPEEETVHNTKLLAASFLPKQLPAPTQTPPAESTETDQA